MKKTGFSTREPLEDDEELGESGWAGPSRSQMKRDAERMQELGKELTGLAPDKLKAVGLDEDTVAAIAEYRAMKSFGAQRRQLQLIGKYMRRYEAAAVREAIDRVTGESAAAVAAHKRSERLREMMLAGDEAVQAFAEAHPEADAQRLRTLVRNARREAQAGKPPKSAREIYRLVYALELAPVELKAPEEDDGEQ